MSIRLSARNPNFVVSKLQFGLEDFVVQFCVARPPEEAEKSCV